MAFAASYLGVGNNYLVVIVLFDLHDHLLIKWNV